MNIADQVLFLKSQEKHMMDETISEEVTKKENKSNNNSEKHFDEKIQREDTTLDLTKDGKTSEIKTREESIIDCITRFLDNLIIILLILVIFSLLSNLVYYMRLYLF